MKKIWIPVKTVLVLIIGFWMFSCGGIVEMGSEYMEQELNVCKGYKSKSSCNADPCCFWKDRCRKKESCGNSGTGGGSTCSSTTCNVSVPNNSCSVSVNPSSVPYGGITTVKLTLRRTSCTGTLAIDPFAKLSLPANVVRVSGYSSNQSGWGVTYYSSSNSYVFDNQNLSYGNSWSVQFDVQVNRNSSDVVKAESWIDLNQTCSEGAGVQKKQDSCSASLSVY